MLFLDKSVDVYRVHAKLSGPGPASYCLLVWVLAADDFVTSPVD